MSLKNEKFSQKYSRQSSGTLRSGSGFASRNTEYAVSLLATPIFVNGRPSGILYRWQTSHILERYMAVWTHGYIAA
jgi:hypothetical protein